MHHLSCIPTAMLIGICCLATKTTAAIALLATDPSSVQCAQQLSSCSCRLSDGRLIDLSPLRAAPGPAFNYEAPDGYTYQFNPCSAYTCGTEADAAVCQEKMQIIIQYTDFGIQSKAQFENDPASGGQLRLRFQSRDSTKTSLVNLHCDPSATDARVSSQGAQDNQLTLDLTSRFACPVASSGGGGGMSAGDILLIVTFCLLAVYLLAGGLINMLIRGQTGRQVVPNYDFWASLPGLAADGAAFAYQRVRALACAGRQGGGGYDDIK